MTQTADRISELRAKGRRAAVATLVATTGGAIRRLGETMWVDDQGAVQFQAGDGRSIALIRPSAHSPGNLDLRGQSVSAARHLGQGC